MSSAFASVLRTELHSPGGRCDVNVGDHLDNTTKLAKVGTCWNKPSFVDAERIEFSQHRSQSVFVTGPSGPDLQVAGKCTYLASSLATRAATGIRRVSSTPPAAKSRGR